MSFDPIDPETVGDRRPSVVEIEDQGPVYVADARVRDNGWLWMKEWSGRTTKVPPRRVLAIKRVETERYDGGEGDRYLKCKRVADPAWRERAKQIPESSGGDAVVADD
ncbi:hypothetical protein [Halomicrobium urmianum]|uniref:hypothetical protein n=1 Tax=Halomicrobium urmianum TaxID=1586233 RepID=UPI001CD92209|nr:hypothetical protein [Halomicrobium urmianum]